MRSKASTALKKSAKHASPAMIKIVVTIRVNSFHLMCYCFFDSGGYQRHSKIDNKTTTN